MKLFSILAKELAFDQYLFEGIDVDINKKIVYFNDSHEDLVDTSEDNPTMKLINGVNTYSVFKRKESNSFMIKDGNPLVYALKGIKGWSISRKDEDKIYYRISSIINKIPKADTIITVPSSNPLVNRFSDYLSRTSQAKVLKHCVTKRTKEEILEDMPWQNFSPREIELIEEAFNKMDYYFESKLFPKDPKIIKKFEVNIFNISKGYELDILDKNIIIINDTISTGLSLSKCSEAIQECYFPKDIFQVSLFSSLS